MGTALYFCFRIPCRLLPTKNLTSVCQHMVDPFYLFHHLLFPFITTLCSLYKGNLGFSLFIYFVFICLLVFYIPSMSEIMQYLSISIWLISLCIISSWSMLLQMARLHLFSWLSSIPFYVYVCVYLYMQMHITQVLYLLIPWWAYTVLPYLGYCK